MRGCSLEGSWQLQIQNLSPGVLPPQSLSLSQDNNQDTYTTTDLVVFEHKYYKLVNRIGNFSRDEHVFHIVSMALLNNNKSSSRPRNLQR